MQGIKLPINDLQSLLSMATKNDNGCLEWSSDRPSIKIDGKVVRLARIVMKLNGYDMSNPKVYACHKCDNPKCINPDHLFPGTSSDNQKDHWRKVKSGERSRMKYPPQRVEQILSARGATKK